MIAFIERVINRDKKGSINKRHLLFCTNCYWCLTYLPDLKKDTIEYFNNCPNCSRELKIMYISEKALADSDSRNNCIKTTELEILVA